MRPAVAHCLSDQRDNARNILTSKEFQAWEVVALKGLSLRDAANVLGISHSSLRDRVASATQKLERYSRSEFPAAPQPEQRPPRERDTSLAIVLLIQRDGPICYLCRNETVPGNRCVEHIIPRSQGGTDEAENLALACAPCNLKKGDKFVSFLTTSERPVYHPAR